MTIAIIGAGAVGSALAQSLIRARHAVLIGAGFPLSEKSIRLATLIGEDRFSTVAGTVQQADVIILATPAPAAVSVAQSLGNTTGKVIIDTANTVGGRGAEGFSSTTEAILAHTATRDVVKCFNSTGAENMLDPVYGGEGVDMFVAGDSARGKELATQLAKDIGFSAVHDFGGLDRCALLESLALCWINLAIFQKGGRDMAFRVVRR